MDKFFFLKGESIVLKPVEIELLPKIASLIEKWINDQVVTYYLFTGQRPHNKEQIIENLKRELKSENNTVFTIADLKTNKIIGYAGLYDLNFTARKAEFRVLIGEKSFWGKGLGTQTTQLLTYYGFDKLNLNRIYLGYTAENRSAGKAYEKAGYVYEGTLKEDIYRNSKYYDSVRMAILREDYYKKFHKLYSNRFIQKK